MIYCLVFLALVVLMIRYDYYDRTNNRMFWYLVLFVVFVLVAGLRYRIGIDSIRYETYYKYKVLGLGEIGSYNFRKDRFEPLFIYLMSACKTVSRDFTLFQIVHALIVNSAVFFFIKRNTRHIFTALFFYWMMEYMMLNTEVLREALAVSVFLFSWEFYKRKRWLPYYLLSLVAIGFHLSAIVLLVLPVLLVPGVSLLFRFNKWTPWVCVGIMAAGFAIQYMFFDIITMLAVTETMVDRAAAYSKDDLGGSIFNIMGTLGVLIRFMIYPCLAMYFINKRQTLKLGHVTEETRMVETMAMMSIYASILTLSIAIFHRYNNYFLMFSIIIISDWMFSKLPAKGKYFRLSFMYWMVIFIPLFIFQVRGQISDENSSGTLKGYMRYLPYSSRLEPEKDRDREALFRYHKAW